MSNLCGLCRHETLEAVYTPDSSTRGLKIHLCRHCGLLQSLPRIDRAARAPAAVSSGAGWGNVRYGKGFRTNAAMVALARHADFTKEISLLDVGSNRGSFAHAFAEAAPNASIVAVEPDERVAQSVRGLARTELIEARIEDAALESGRFDIVHSSHTLEHVADPSAVIADHWRVLKDGGLLMIDVPNVALLASDDMIEEWFIDKHLYHFSAHTLCAMVQAEGFEIIQRADPRDRENLLIVARKAANSSKFVAFDGGEVDAAQALIAAYGANRAINFAALSSVAAEIAAMAPRRVVLWGAGRIFDSLVVNGGFDPALPVLLVDTHLQKLVGERFGRPLATPDAIAEAKPGVIVVMSRGFAGEITAQARKLAPHAEILSYGDLLSRARMQRAA
jgi:FkbM family methyltransferase